MARKRSGGLEPAEPASLNDVSTSKPDDPDNYKVGPGHPPREYRWRKGCPSPHPEGRPPKKRVQTLLEAMDPFSAAVLDHGQFEIPLRKDQRSRISRFTANLDALFKQSVTGHFRASLGYHKIQEEAAAKKKQMFEQSILAAMQHQEKWMDKFLEAERLGKPLPDVYPDPRDIIITLDGIIITGPITRADKIRDEKLVKKRDNLVEIWLEMDGPGIANSEKRKTQKIARSLFKIYDDALSLKYRASFAQILRRCRNDWNADIPIGSAGPADSG